MKLATARIQGATRAVRVEGDTLVDLGHADLGEFLAEPDWTEQARSATTQTYPAHGVEFATLVPQPSKVVCVGLNYRKHIQEMGRDLPEYPTLFSKFADTLIGATDAIVRPAEMVRLNPGDIIATGTPGGVGHARKPERYLLGGESVIAEIDGIGRLENRVVKDGA